ncbi:MAG: alpha-amylase family glycosyl hydrolase [Anaerolineae bacterium]
MWWQNGVVYQIYPSSFQDSNGDGLGDLVGVMQRLDYLAELGVDAIWFSPIFPSPMADFGYDVADYVDIHPQFGSLAVFDDLLAAAHARNIKIILDLVPNHTSVEHPWFKEARSSRDNPKRDWYIWKDPAPDGGLPNNWMAYFGGPAWTFDETTGQYYMHNFDPGQPELNWRNPEVEQAMHDVMRFWLRRGVDGFRIDVIGHIIKDADFRDNPVTADGQIQRIYSEQQPEVHQYIHRIRRVFDEFPNTVSIGEVPYEFSPLNQESYYGTEETPELHLPFNFGLIPLSWNAELIRSAADAYDASIPSHGWPNNVLGNHDSPRIASKYGPAQARVATMLLLTLRGTPTLYYGDEIGMTNVTIPKERILDPQGRNTDKFNRDECRTPMQWNAGLHAGFSDNPDTELWLPLAGDYETVNVTVQENDPQSTLALNKALLALRRAEPALHLGTYQSLQGADGCFVYMRQHADSQFVIALNFTSETKTLHLRDLAGTVAVSTLMDRQGDAVNLSALELRPDEGVIVRLGGG